MFLPALFFSLLLRTVIPAAGPMKVTDAFLDSVRVKYNLPAMGVGVIEGDTLSFMSVAGVRKAGDPSLVHLRDAWHLGSCTKAVTAMVIARLIEQGKLSMSTTVGSLYPEYRAKFKPVYDSLTLQMLLEHRSGLSHDWPRQYTRRLFDTMTTSLTAQRVYFLRLMMQNDPEFAPNTKYNYSNAGYVIAAAMAERATGVAYETLADSLVFRPLGIMTAGWGPMNSTFMTNGIWAHLTDSSGKAQPIDNTVDGDNPALYNPAGRLHVSLEGWSKFIRSLLPGSKRHLVSDSMLSLILAKPQVGEYDFGWSHVKRAWANGIALSHGGSNGMNFANVWVAPQKHFAVMVTVNAFSPAAQQAAEEVISRAILSEP